MYSHGKNGSGVRIDQQRAPSTAEEFKRVADEKSQQGLSSQTVEKAAEAAVAAARSSKLERVKEAYKESPGRGDLHNEGDKR